MNFLVGYTGFVGSNIASQTMFDGLFNSKNYQQAFGENPDLLIYSGVAAEKFLANQFPEKDKKNIEQAFENILKIAPKTLVLISTIDVYKEPFDVDENSMIDMDGQHAYGLNRYLLEQMVFENKHLFDKVLVVRLPGLFGENLKKNFIYDLIHVIPSMLNQAKYEQLSNKSELIQKQYVLQDNGFYKCMTRDPIKLDALKKDFQTASFTALNFTDSRAKFQFYNLQYLYGHITEALENDIQLLNIANEPVSTSEIYQLVHEDAFVNELDRPVPSYDFKTRYCDVFCGRNGYIFDKAHVLTDIKKYLLRYM